MPKHIIERHIIDGAIDPNEAERHESPMFRQAKKRLKEDGHYRCWICGTTANIQIHHYGAEWMYASLVNFDALKDFCETWDVYGYGRLLRQQPINTVDDIRNLMALCAGHHEEVDREDGGTGTGIHNLTFSTWLIQNVARPGLNPVPQKGETFAVVMTRLHQREGGSI